jgi:apolipoprotein D and lipocalin family protein
MFTNILPIPVVKRVDLDKYIGKWYQVATSRSTKLFGTGIDYHNVTAEYKRYNNNITIVNKGYDAKNVYRNITGYSYCHGNPAKRKVHFDGVVFDGSYWIVKLKQVGDIYEYAVVAGPLTSIFGTRFSLYVLARDKKIYKELYENEVIAWCNKNGFTRWWNCYVATN